MFQIGGTARCVQVVAPRHNDRGGPTHPRSPDRVHLKDRLLVESQTESWAGGSKSVCSSVLSGLINECASVGPE